jgi:hypothetical protein
VFKRKIDGYGFAYAGTAVWNVFCAPTNVDVCALAATLYHHATPAVVDNGAFQGAGAVRVDRRGDEERQNCRDRDYGDRN